MNVVQEAVNSKDGTRIVFDRQGDGPALIVVDGALCTRSSGSKPELVNLLAPDFTVYSYDRRGRGDSGDTTPYAVAREIEDIAALIDDAGGTAYLYGHSSGAALALEAAATLGTSIKKLAMYEAPYKADRAAQAEWGAYIHQLRSLLAANRRGDAIALFMALVGTPADAIDAMRHAPYWPAFEALAPTLAYDQIAILGEDGAVPTERAAHVLVPTLIMNGSESHPMMDAAARALSTAIPHAQHHILDGQQHNVSPAVLAPILTAFFGA